MVIKSKSLNLNSQISFDDKKSSFPKYPIDKKLHFADKYLHSIDLILF